MDVSNLKEVGVLEYASGGVTLEEKYPLLYNGKPQQFLCQTREDMYTLAVSINYTADRLYFRLFKPNGEPLIGYVPLVEELNLVNNFIPGYALIFQNNALYFGEL